MGKMDIGKKMSPVSFFALRLEMVRKGKVIGSGTGFIYKSDRVEQNFLVTNYHVLTARYPTKPEILLPEFEGSPDEIRFSLLRKDNYQPTHSTVSMLQGGKPISWLEHKDRAQGVDIVAIPVEPPQDVIVISQRELDLVDDINFEVGSDLFIIGFPFGFAAGQFFPIWKRGTVASEPLFRPNGLPMFYIDSFTNPGMSGSPVLAVEIRAVTLLKSEHARLFEKFQRKELSALDVMRHLDQDSLSRSQHKKYLQLVGIYSANILVGIDPANREDPNIGVVWQKELIDEILINPCYVEHPFLS